MARRRCLPSADGVDSTGLRRLALASALSWSAHDFEAYVIQRHLGVRVSLLPLLVGTYAPDAFTKWFVYGANIGPLRLLELTSAKAARGFGLNGGALAPGRDADLVLVDPDREWTAGEGGDRIASKCGWSPYAGMALVGRPEVAVVAGTVVHQHLD